jgi:hypothetical protein
MEVVSLTTQSPPGGGGVALPLTPAIPGGGMIMMAASAIIKIPRKTPRIFLIFDIAG